MATLSVETKNLTTGIAASTKQSWLSGVEKSTRLLNAAASHVVIVALPGSLHGSCEGLASAHTGTNQESSRQK